MSGDDLCFLGAAELGRRIARRELSPIEVAEAHLGRIAALDPKLNAFLLVTAERALEEARAAGREIAAGRGRGPLHGVPLALKDLFDVAGLATTAGSRILAGEVAARDAAATARLREAGLVLLGKTNLHEFAFGITSDNPHFGPCRNPWDTARSPGGSSGGSGAALAAGLCAASLGTDTGGSIRIPAAACGVVGLKPTLGRVSRRGVVPLCWSLDTVGPMARTVEDVALLMDAIAGPDPEDGACAPRPGEAFGRELEAGARGVALGVPREWFFDGVEAGIVAAVEAALVALEREGARRVAVATPGMAGRTPRTTPSWRSRRPRSTGAGCVSARATTATTCGAGSSSARSCRRWTTSTPGGCRRWRAPPSPRRWSAPTCWSRRRCPRRRRRWASRCRASRPWPGTGCSRRSTSRACRRRRCPAGSTARACRWGCRSSAAPSPRRASCAWRGRSSG